MHLGPLPYLYAKNEIMTLLHVAILTVKKELPNRVSTQPLYVK